MRVKELIKLLQAEIRDLKGYNPRVAIVEDYDHYVVESVGMSYIDTDNVPDDIDDDDDDDPYEDVIVIKANWSDKL
tara:strand:+ start:368 stop:595 length:228 start_codon:yes stop_codon:yes gene_type:complete